MKKPLNGSLRSRIAAPSRAQRCFNLMNFYELHQESFHRHHDMLDEENDGSERNRCKSLFSRLTVKTVHFINASLKSDRSFISELRPDVLREIHQFII